MICMNDMPPRRKQSTRRKANGRLAPRSAGPFKEHAPGADLLAQADGILKRYTAISTADEEVLFKALQRCDAIAQREIEEQEQGNDEVQSQGGIDALRKEVVARLVERNIPLVYEMRKRFNMIGADPDEMLSEGFWTLYRAVQGFDVDRGLRFSTYACRSILYAFLSLANKRRRERVILQKLLAERRDSVSTDDPDVSIEGHMFMDTVHASLTDESAAFSDVERFVIERRFLSGSPDGPPTLESIGRSFHLSKERVRQIQSGALMKLRIALTGRRACGNRRAPYDRKELALA